MRFRFNNVTFLTLLASAALARPLQTTLAPCPGETFNQKKQENQNGDERAHGQPGKCDREWHKKHRFDVEAVFLVPFAVAFTGLPVGAFVAILIFLLLLIEGLAWAWGKGCLQWVR